MKDLTGRIAVVTGGSRGIGRAIVERLSGDGATVITGSTREPSDRLPKGVIWHPLDVASDAASPASIDSLLDRAHRDHGRIDILVNNAGIEIEETTENSSDQDWQRMTDINMKAVFLAARTVIPLMRQQGGGVIVNLGSISAACSDPNLALYNASKAWVVSLTRSIAVDHGKDGIRCNAVCPGWIMTDMLMQTLGQSPDLNNAIEDARRKHPVGRLGKPADIANAVAWLVSDEATFVSGTTLTVDGGLTAGAPIDPAGTG